LQGTNRNAKILIQLIRFQQFGLLAAKLTLLSSAFIMWRAFVFSEHFDLLIKLIPKGSNAVALYPPVFCDQTS